MNGDVVDVETFHGTDEGIVIKGTFGIGRGFISDTSEGRVREISDEVVTFENWKLSGITFVMGTTNVVHSVEFF